MAGRTGAVAQTNAATPIAAGRKVQRLKNPYLDDIAVSSDPGPYLEQRADHSIYSQCSKLQPSGYGVRERRQKAFLTRPFDPGAGGGAPSRRPSPSNYT